MYHPVKIKIRIHATTPKRTRTIPTSHSQESLKKLHYHQHHVCDDTIALLYIFDGPQRMKACKQQHDKNGSSV